MDVTVDRLDPTGWQQLRDLRLEALLDVPSAFWATWEDESRYGVQDWTRFARAVQWFVATSDGHPVGLAGALRRDECPDEPEVIGMWVRNRERGRGTGSALLAAIVRWADGERAAALTLWVTHGNDRARDLYQRHGFALTGEEAPLAAGRAGGEARMRRALVQRTCGRVRGAQR